MRISFNDYVFTDAGSSQFSRASRFDPDPHTGKAERELVTWKIKETFLEPSFADNEARFADLMAALSDTSGGRTSGEGLLVITERCGRILFSDTVRVAAHDLPEQWGQYTTDVTVDFAALPKPVAQAGVDGTFTPSGSSTAVVLPRVTGWKESVKTDRYDAPYVPNRSKTSVHISASGRFTADPTQSEALRKLAVLAVKTALETINDAPDGTLVFASMSNVVMVETCDVEIGDGTSYCEWSLAASYMRFPDGDYAEVEFDVDTKDAIEQAERTTSVTGKIRANTEDAALARANALRDTFAEVGRIQSVNDTKTQQVDGTDGLAFIEMTFTFEWKETLAPVAWTLTVTTKADTKSNAQILTRAGTCRSGDMGAALTRAEALGMVSGQGVLMATSLEFHSRGLEDAEQDYELTFSYEYLSRAGRVYGEASNDQSDEAFSDNAQVISGFVVANTQAVALALARSFKLGDGYLLRSARENCSAFNAGSGTDDTAGFDAGGVSQQFLKCDFSYTYYAGHTEEGLGSAKYSVGDSRDMKTRIKTLTYTGTAWAVDVDTANSLIDSIIGTPDGAQTKRDRKVDTEQRDVVSGFLAVSFTDTFEGAFAAAEGESVLEAEWSIEAVLSVNLAIVTEIPFGVPVVQTACGYNKGSVTVTGFCTAITEAYAKAWGRATRAIVQASGYYERAPREKIGYATYFEAPDSVRLFRFDFTYSCEVALLTDGL